MESLSGELSEFGFCLASGLLSETELGRFRSAIEAGLLSQSRELIETGQLHSKYQEVASSLDKGMTLLQEWEIEPSCLPLIGNNVRRELADAVDIMRQNRSIIELAKSLLGSRIVATPQFAVRAHCPRSIEFLFPWHQDVFFLDIDDKVSVRVINFWIPIVPIEMDSGGLDIIEGSHQFGVFPHIKARERLDAPLFTGIAPDMLPPGKLVSPTLKLGDVLIMLDKTVHRTRLNTSERVRWSLDIRYSEASRPLGRSGAFIVIP